jgi:hypothetical protein
MKRFSLLMTTDSRLNEAGAVLLPSVEPPHTMATKRYQENAQSTVTDE